MIPHELLETAQAYRLLADLAPRHLTKLLPLAKDAAFARGQVIFAEGAQSTHLHLIVGGTVALETMAAGRPIRVQTLNAGEAMGWSSISDAGRTHFQARALTPVSTVAFSGDALRKACEADPELGYVLMKELLDLVSERLDATRMQLVDMYAKPEAQKNMMLAAPPHAGELARPAVAQVSEVLRETYDTCTLTLDPEPGETLAAFAPGQFSMLYPFGAGEVPISISGDPGVPGRLTYSIRSVGKASGALVNLRRGERVGVRGPFGTGWPVEIAKGGDVLLIAGGIGMAPLRPVIYHFLRHRKDYGRLTLLYGARSPKDMLYGKELKAWSGVLGAQVLTTVDRSRGAWRGQVGVVTNLIDAVVVQPENTTAMMCGPEIMMRFVVRKLRDRKMDAARIYLSLERNMKCAMGFCGHCQMGPFFLCKDGPVFSYDRVRTWMEGRSEL